jgi:hypothetical protein
MAKEKTAKVEKEYTIDFEEYAIRGADGSVDQEATVTRFAEQLATFAEQDRIVSQTVMTALNAAFDAQPVKGVHLAMPSVVFLTMKELHLDESTNIPALQAKIGSVVRSSPEFKVVRGKGGGVVRVCDMAPEAK